MCGLGTNKTRLEGVKKQKKKRKLLPKERDVDRLEGALKGLKNLFFSFFLNLFGFYSNVVLLDILLLLLLL